MITFGQCALPLAPFRAIQRWHNTSPDNCSINGIGCLLLSGWKNSSRRVGSSLLVATGWEAKGKRMLFPFLGGLRAIPDFGICRRLFSQGAWWFAWAGGCLSPTNSFAPEQWGSCLKGVEQSLFPGVMGLSSMEGLLLGYVGLSVEIFLQFPWQEQWVTHIPSGGISMFLLFFRLLWHFPSPVVGASGSSIYTAVDHVPTGNNLALQPSAVNTLTSAAHGMHSLGVSFSCKTLNPTVVTSMIVCSVVPGPASFFIAVNPNDL